MAIDISKNATHNIAFPSFVASAMGQYGHVINLVMQADQDNGVLAAKGDYVSFEQYEMDAVADNKVEGVIREAAAEGGWYVEFTKLMVSISLFITHRLVRIPKQNLETRLSSTTLLAM